jgi:mycothiol synthase
VSAEHDRREALNEDAVLRLKNRGLAESLMLLAGDEGFAYVHDGAVDLVVTPAARGQGLGRSLASAVLERVEGPLSAWSHGNHPGAAALARSCGFAAVRELWMMRAPLAPLSVEAPPGYAIRAYRPGEDDAGFLAVNAAAFASHPEQGSLDRRGLLERMAEPWFDPAGFLVGERDGELVGYHWTKVHSDGRQPMFGEVYVIGVDPSTQGSGLGRALLAAGLEHLRGLGLSEVVLYVEGDNDGAIRLYERYGFTHAAVDTDVMYVRS